jgi:hypothetical protein
MKSPSCRWLLKLALLLALILPVPAALSAAEPAAEDFPSVTLWPLVWHRESPEERVTDVLWPIYHKERQGSRERVALRPFLFSLETDPDREFRRLQVLWPLSRFEHKGDTERDYVFPVFWQGHAEGRQWLHLWPLFGRSLQADGTRTLSTLYPFFQYASNEQNGAYSVDAPWPLVNRFRREGAEGGRVLPFWWRHKTAAADGGLLFPYLWYDTEEARRQAILPLWYRSRTADSRLSLLLPLYFSQEKEDSSRQLIFPLWYRSRAPDSSTELLAPFWFDHRWQENRFRTLFPLYWQQEDADSRFRLIVPLHGRHVGPETETSAWLPVYFHHRDREVQSDLVYYFPVYGRYTLRERVTRHLFLFPLYAHFVDLEQDHRSWNVLWPLFHYETAPEFYQAWALPFYWHSRSPAAERTMAFGLYWSNRRQDTGSTWLVPVYAHLFSPEKEQRHVPLLYSTFRRADGYRKSLLLGPLYIATEDPKHERRQTDVLWPLISHKEEKEKSHTRALPFYWHTRRPERDFSLGSLALLPPYYLREETPEHSLWHLWPFFGKARQGSYEEVSSLWPLLRWGDDPAGDRRTRQFLLAYSLEHGEVHRSGFFPLWHRRQEPGKVKTLSLLHWNEKEAARDVSRFAILHLGDPDFSLFSLKHDGEKSRHRLFPLYRLARNEKNQSRQLSILGPVFSRRWSPEHSRTRLLWKTLYFEHGPAKEESGLLWRLVRSYRDPDREIFEFNPFYYREKKADGEEYRSWLGGIFATRQREGEIGQHRLFWLVKW